MIDSQTALQLVSEHLTKMERDMNDCRSALPDNENNPYLHLVIAGITEHDFGWVFFYDTKEYLETNDVTHALAGNAPLIVDRTDG